MFEGANNYSCYKRDRSTNNLRAVLSYPNASDFDPDYFVGQSLKLKRTASLEAT